MTHTNPKGTLIPIGGGEDREESKDILNRIISETGKKNPTICLITLATDLPEDVAETYNKAFADLKISTIFTIYYNNRTEADTDENLEKIKSCDLLFLSGGNQLKLGTLLGGTELLQLTKQRLLDEANFIVAGTSAGATAMSNTMIISSSHKKALLKGSLELTNGLDLINKICIDTHFIQRERIARLIQTVTYNPGILGLGIAEDTSVIIKEDVLEIFGSGMVIIVDGKEIAYTDLADIQEDTPITVEGIKLHVLGPGKKFSIGERRIKTE